MAVGNLIISSGCVWDEEGLNIPAQQYAISEGPFIPGAEGDYTVSLAIKYTRHDSGETVIIGESDNFYSSVLGALFSLTRSYNNLIVSYHYSDSGYDYQNLGNFFSSELNYVIDMVYTNKHIWVYKNGKLFYDRNVSGTLFEPTIILGLKCCTNSSGMHSRYNSEIKYYAINLYDRALSAEEIEQNFNTYNERFNLGL